MVPSRNGSDWATDRNTTWKQVQNYTDRLFSKWAEETGLPDKTADGVARFMYSVSLK